MAKKQLRTVKKSSETGRVDRAAARAAVITVRDGRTGQLDARSNGAMSGSRKSGQSAGGTASRAA